MPYKFLLVFICCFLVANSVTAQRGQRPTSGGGGAGFGGGQPQAGNSNYKEENPDTANVVFFYPDRIDESFTFSDTLLGNYFHQYDPIRYRLLDYAHLGNMGSAARPLVFEPRVHQGVEVGLNQYDIYYRGSDEVPFYIVNQALTDMYFSQGSEQEDGYFKLKFTRNFAKGIHLTLDHHRIFHIVRETTLRQTGSYLPQRTRYTQFAVGLWYQAENKKYDGFFSFSNNVAEQEENGGITPEGDDLLLNDTTSGDFTVNTFLTEANTRHQNREFAYTQYYRLGLQEEEDSTKSKKPQFTLYHKASFLSSVYKFADESASDNEEYYQNFLFDDRGVRQFVRQKKIENQFRISTGNLQTATASSGKQQLEVGLNHAINYLTLEPVDSIINTIYLTGRLLLSLKDRLQLRANAHFGVLGNIGDYRLNGLLFLDLKKAGNFRFQFTNQLYTPTLFSQRLFISQQEFWNNDFKKPLETTLGATYTLPKFGLELSGKFHLLNNFIYYDTLALAQQIGNPVSVLQLIARKNFRLGKFSLDNTVVFQQATEEVIRLPQIYSKHSLYFESGMFKRALLLRLGVDTRFNTPYFADAYQPVTGQFHLQTQREAPLYPATDVFLSLKVTRYSFRFFVKLENINSLISNEYYFQTYRYPVPDLSIRLGVSWRLLN